MSVAAATDVSSTEFDLFCFWFWDFGCLALGFRLASSLACWPGSRASKCDVSEIGKTSVSGSGHRRFPSDFDVLHVWLWGLGSLVLVFWFALSFGWRPGSWASKCHVFDR